jgi:hypothetical protein
MGEITGQTMRDPAKVKTSLTGGLALTIAPLFVALGLYAQDIDPLRPKGSEPPPLDARTAGLLRLLHPPLEARLFPVVDRLDLKKTVIRISLKEHRMRIFSSDELAVDCPASTGRPGNGTPEGDFTLTEKIVAPKGLDYGHIVGPDGTLLVRGAFARHDPLPAGASFDAVVPKCGFRLSAGGPVLFAGEATGAATSNGAVVIPEKIALLLFDKLEPGVRIAIEP